MNKLMKEIWSVIIGCALVMFIMLVSLPNENLTLHYIIVTIFGVIAIGYFGYQYGVKNV